jgi:hypothetical protein
MPPDLRKERIGKIYVWSSMSTFYPKKTRCKAQFRENVHRYYWNALLISAIIHRAKDLHTELRFV